MSKIKARRAFMVDLAMEQKEKRSGLVEFNDYSIDVWGLMPSHFASGVSGAENLVIIKT